MPSVQERFERSISSIRGLPGGQPCWFWATSRGPEGDPFLVVVEQPTDPDGKKFRRRVQWVCDQTDSLGPTTQGVLRRLGSGRLTLMTPHTLSRACAVYGYTCRFGPLPDVLVMQLDGEAVQTARLVENLGALDAEVDAITPAARCWFGIADGPPAIRFCMAKDRAGVLAKLDGAADPSVGQLRRTPDQGFALRVRDIHKTRPLSMLMQRWGQGDAIHWPALRKLSSARVTVKEAPRHG